MCGILPWLLLLGASLLAGLFGYRWGRQDRSSQLESFNVDSSATLPVVAVSVEDAETTTATTDRMRELQDRNNYLKRKIGAIEADLVKKEEHVISVEREADQLRAEVQRLSAELKAIQLDKSIVAVASSKSTVVKEATGNSTTVNKPRKKRKTTVDAAVQEELKRLRKYKMAARKDVKNLRQKAKSMRRKIAKLKAKKEATNDVVKQVEIVKGYDVKELVKLVEKLKPKELSRSEKIVKNNTKKKQTGKHFVTVMRYYCGNSFSYPENRNYEGVVAAQAILQDAYRTDVRPLTRQARLAAGAAIDPIATDRSLGIRDALVEM